MRSPPRPRAGCPGWPPKARPTTRLGSAIDTFNDPVPPAGWADYPGLGLDERAVYLTYIVSNTSGRLLVFPKTDLYDDGAAVFFDFLGLKNPDGRDALPVQPCHHFGPTTTAHLVNTSPGVDPSKDVVLRTVSWSAKRQSSSTRKPSTWAGSAYGAPCPARGRSGSRSPRHTAPVRRRHLDRRALVPDRRRHGSRTRQDELAEPGSYHVFPNLVVDPAGTLTLPWQSSV